MKVITLILISLSNLFLNFVLVSSTKAYEPIGMSIKNVVSNTYVTCAITTSDELYCFGRNNQSQIGNGDTNDVITPYLTMKDVEAISIGYGEDKAHACAIKKDKTLWCWGYNNHGQVGDGTTKVKSRPVLVKGELEGKEVVSLGLGFAHTCVLTSESKNNLYCWGYNAYGQIGDGTTNDQLLPKNILGSLENKKIDNLSVGVNQTCVTTTDNKNNLYCWGANDNGQIGTGTSNRDLKFDETGNISFGDVKSENDDETDEKNHCQKLPFNVLGVLDNKKVQNVTMRGKHVCAITNETKGNLYCWGLNASGQIGIGDYKQNGDVPLYVTFPSRALGDLE